MTEEKAPPFFRWVFWNVRTIVLGILSLVWAVMGSYSLVSFLMLLVAYVGGYFIGSAILYFFLYKFDDSEVKPPPA